MPDTRREKVDLQGLHADNATGDISPQDNRDGWETCHPAAGVQSGTYASLPSSGRVTGDLYLPTNGAHVHRFDGSAWKAFGPSFPLTPVPSSGWTSVGTITATASGGTLNVYSANAAGANGLRGQYRTAPATPWTATFLFAFSPSWLDDAAAGNGIADAGVFLRDAGGKYISYMIEVGNNPINKLLGYAWDSSTSINTTYLNRQVQVGAHTLIWMQLFDNATNVGLRLSPDGVDWTIVPDSRSRTGFMGSGPTAYGFGVNPYSMKISATLLSLKEA